MACNRQRLHIEECGIVGDEVLGSAFQRSCGLGGEAHALSLLRGGPKFIDGTASPLAR